MNNEKIKEGAEVVMNCLPSKPTGQIMIVKEASVFVSLSDASVFEVSKEDLIDGKDKLIAINFKRRAAVASDNINALGEKALESMKNISKKLESDPQADIFDLFLQLCIDKIDEKQGYSIFPYPLLMRSYKGTGIGALMASPDDIMKGLKKALDQENPADLFFALDRSVRPNQGIDERYKYFLTIYKKNSHNEWQFGTLGYNSREDVQKEVDWNNQLWITRMKMELSNADILKFEGKIGTAFKGKIEIETYQENEHGSFYEGPINLEKLEETTKKFLGKNGLNINDKEAVIEFFKKRGMNFTFTNDTHGFVTLLIEGSGHIFPSRRSRTRAYLEGVETIIKTYDEKG